MATVAGVMFRAATVDDARAIAEVHVASWRWAYDGLLPQTVLDGLSVDERARGWTPIVAADPRSVVVALDGDRVIGFASVGPTRDDDPPPGTGEVFALYLVPEVAGTGVGEALLRRAEARLRETGFVRATLWVLETNERARRFYERCGWSWDGTTGEHRFDCGNRPIVRYGEPL
ncbi:MAG TPA: GNAT family N-acetyltransferase [Actinomycetota bacterium]|nr:GNAT family N-acetyltransferase [Actinomycetota bacterium]